MQYKTDVYKFDALFERIKKSRSGNPAIRGKNLRARILGDHRIVIRHHYTDIATIEEYSADGTLYLWIDADGYRSATTKHYLNEILRAYNTDAVIWQKDFVWYVAGDGYTYEYEDGLVFWGRK